MLFVLGGKDYETKEPVILVDGRLRLRFGVVMPLVDVQEITISDSEDEDIQEKPAKRARTEATSTGETKGRPASEEPGDDERENASGKGRSSSGDTGKGSSRGESPSYTPGPSMGRGRGRFTAREATGDGVPRGMGPDMSDRFPPAWEAGPSSSNGGPSASDSRPSASTSGPSMDNSRLEEILTYLETLLDDL
jgi:hypothetical protein